MNDDAPTPEELLAIARGDEVETGDAFYRVRRFHDRARLGELLLRWLAVWVVFPKEWQHRPVLAGYDAGIRIRRTGQ